MMKNNLDPPDDRWIRDGPNSYWLPRDTMTIAEKTASKKRYKKFKTKRIVRSIMDDIIDEASSCNSNQSLHTDSSISNSGYKDVKKRCEIINLINDGYSYEYIMNLPVTASRLGFIYETIVIVLLISKSLLQNYIEISDTKLTKNNLVFKITKSVKELFDKSLNDGNNQSDISIKTEIGWTPWSVKYKKGKGDSDLVPCKDYMETYSKRVNEPYSLGYIVKDKHLLNWNDDGRAEADVVETARKDGHLFDETDVKKAYVKFQKLLRGEQLSSITDIYKWMDSKYLNVNRIHLKLKFHQNLAMMLFKGNINDMMHCLSLRPRTGKTIIMLLFAKYLLSVGYKRVLIMTSIPATIRSFVDELNKYYEFENIEYREQKDFMDIDESFKGISFCSVQYLKIQSSKKKDKLLLYDCNIFDECHFHSSNKNTYDKIINIHEGKKIMRIFASGTSGKTEWFYNIPPRCVYKWDSQDDNMMKNMG